jgi:hypothetical protein
MTRIDFYSNVANKAQFLAELVQGAPNMATASNQFCAECDGQ